jgi:hypothetical protein
VHTTSYATDGYFSFPQYMFLYGLVHLSQPTCAQSTELTQPGSPIDAYSSTTNL